MRSSPLCGAAPPLTTGPSRLAPHNGLPSKAGDEAIGRPELARSERGRDCAGTGPQLVDRIELEVDLGGRRARVAEPERDLTDVAGGFEHSQRAGVPQHVRRE